MQDQKLNNNNKKILRKSQLLLMGSFLIFIGIFILSYHHLKYLKKQVFSNMELAIMDLYRPINNDVLETPEKEEIDVPNVDNITNNSSNYQPPNNVVDYSKYLGVLEIPKISLKRGFYSTNSKYNNIQYNVTLVPGSTMPDIVNGNLMLMAHSGDAYISYFAFLYRLNVGDFAYINYQGNKYKYQIVNIYTVPKNGKVIIYRNYNKTTLTLITCTKDDNTTQTVYIAELVS